MDIVYFCFPPELREYTHLITLFDGLCNVMSFLPPLCAGTVTKG